MERCCSSDRNLRYLMADGEALLASIGFSRQALVGKVLADVVVAEQLAAIELRYRAALAGETQGFESVRGEKTYAVTIAPVKDAHGEVSAGMTPYLRCQQPQAHGGGAARANTAGE